LLENRAQPDTETGLSVCPANDRLGECSENLENCSESVQKIQKLTRKDYWLWLAYWWNLHGEVLLINHMFVR